MTKAKGMITINVKKCVACKTCELECALAHSPEKDLAKAMRLEVKPQPRISVDPIGSYSVPLQCRHCEDAPCVAVCPTKAMTKLGVEGPVLVDLDSCIGCKACIIVCPFGVIKLSRSGKVISKCDLCIDRLEQGQKPACVSGCPTGCLQFQTVDEVAAEAKKKVGREFLVSIEKVETLHAVK
ncbi:MAG: 4Fe-4S dicluster domain-containing protein [Candidatus Tectomicrobia bacterium]|uniref:4Fe-4S dicluster domain-containing protein n=1 Tax=Tectimicrobiota bacterium TaxID=2528274 RepID=A0A933GKY6_UNCTE|nr:4Fe-4S dicluster domain-containing protein [Candidatus Tectomicrobia bacterium]